MAKNTDKNQDKSLVARHSGTLSASVESASTLLNLREKVKQNTALVSDEWLDRLIKWADEKMLPSKKEKDNLCEYPIYYLIKWQSKPFYKNYFPRDKDELRKVSGLFFERYIDELPNEFSNFTELELLYIQNLKKFPNFISKLKRLKALGLHSCDKSFCSSKEFVLPKEFASLSNLEILSLDYYYLKRFPKVILKFKLLALSLRSCGLSSIPRGFEVLAKHIKVVFLDDNPLKNVPTALYKCLKIKHLHLHDCGLRTLSKRFARLQNLQTLYLNNNNFAEFPKVIFELKNLKKLKIDSHLITPEIREKLQEMGVDAHLNET